MYKELIISLPLEFQKLKKTEKQTKINNGKMFTMVDFYQSKNIKPECFYKPISKIIRFDF
jgi:hypothetical protein